MGNGREWENASIVINTFVGWEHRINGLNDRIVKANELMIEDCLTDQVLDRIYLELNHVLITDFYCAESRISDRCGWNGSFVAYACKDDHVFDDQTCMHLF